MKKTKFENIKSELFKPINKNDLSNIKGGIRSMGLVSHALAFTIDYTKCEDDSLGNPRCNDKSFDK